MTSDGQAAIYLNGNSLGLQCNLAAATLQDEIERWATYGVQGWHHPEKPWIPFHEQLTLPLARLVGANPTEVVATHSLTVNLHLMLVSFYRPKGQRKKVVMEAAAFPSDLYAVKSYMRLLDIDEDNLVLLTPRPGEDTLRTEDILQILQELDGTLALVLIGGVNYLTGQLFDLPVIAAAARRQGAIVGTDLAHAIGNVPLQLHDWGVDFAVWCSYKYLNGGPGAVGGLFIHERHLVRPDIQRLEGWWGHDKATRFAMPPDFQPIPTAEAWQISTPSIFAMAPLAGALQLFEQAGLPALREKSLSVTDYFLSRISTLPADRIEVITPREHAARGAQLSLRVPGAGKSLHRQLLDAGVICDWREPDIIRVAFAPLYNSYTDAARFADLLCRLLGA